MPSVIIKENYENTFLKPNDINQIYSDYHDFIWKFAMSLCKNYDDACDISQMVFLKLIKRMQKKKISRRNLKSYLYSMAYYTFIDYYRWNTKQDAVFGRFVDDLEALTGRNVALPGDETSETRWESVRDILCDGIFTQRQIQIFVLKFYAHLQGSEIAEVLEISRRSVFRELKLVLLRLRKAFEKAGLAPEDVGFETRRSVL